MASIRTCIALTVLVGIVVSDGCHRPILDRAELTAVSTEAAALMRRHPTTPTHGDVPPKDWPAAIRRLKPERVTISNWGLDISMKSFFDEGWGYHVADDRSKLPMPDDGYREVANNLYWHGPY